MCFHVCKSLLTKGSLESNVAREKSGYCPKDVQNPLDGYCPKDVQNLLDGYCSKDVQNPLDEVWMSCCLVLPHGL